MKKVKIPTNEGIEPIPSEPQTRWVNVFLGNDAYCKHDSVTFDEKPNKAADFSVQQKLVNDKWVNV